MRLTIFLLGFSRTPLERQEIQSNIIFQKLLKSFHICDAYYEEWAEMIMSYGDGIDEEVLTFVDAASGEEPFNEALLDGTIYLSEVSF